VKRAKLHCERSEQLHFCKAKTSPKVRDKCDFQPMVKNQNTAVLGNILGKNGYFSLEIALSCKNEKNYIKNIR